MQHGSNIAIYFTYGELIDIVSIRFISAAMYVCIRLAKTRPMFVAERHTENLLVFVPLVALSFVCAP